MTVDPVSLLAARAGVDEPDTLRILARLEAAGLVERMDGAWSARPDVLRQAMADGGTYWRTGGAVDP